MKWILILGSLVVAAGILVSLRFGFGPKPVAQINPSVFSTYEEIGAAVYRRVRAHVREGTVVILGSSPFLPESARIWTGFIRVAQKDKILFDPFIEEESVPPIKEISPLIRSELRPNWEDLSWAESLKSSPRLSPALIHTSSMISSHLVDGAVLQAFREKIIRPVIAISLTEYKVSKSEIGDGFRPPCPEGPESPDGLENLSCAALKTSRKFLRKRISKDSLAAAMEKLGLADFVLYIHQPETQTNGSTK